MCGMFWGPLYFVMDAVPENRVTGVILCAILLPCIVAFPIRPNRITATVSLLAIVCWLSLGVIGAAIGC